MKLIEALRIVNQALPDAGPSWEGALVCGFTALHLETYLAAHLRLQLQGRSLAVRTGLYGDLPGNLERQIGSALDGCAVVLEWPDLDPRLGLRQLGGWRPKDLADILQSVRLRTKRIHQALETLAATRPVALCLPTLALPPVASAPGWQASSFELELREALSAFAAGLATLGGISMVNAQRLERISPPAERADLKSELHSGFPYTLSHASAVAELLVRLLVPIQPKKGLITDLDDTLWSGILGEDGVEGIAWDLDHASQMHGLYQQFLVSLSETGVLLAGATKNDPQVVQQAFRREDLVVGQERLFPMEAHWGPKSQSVARILQTWNIGADSVVFVDDSPMELAEVKAAHPDIECLRFPKGDDQAVYELLVKLRDMFGKSRIYEEDALRMESIRRGVTLREEDLLPGHSLESFLAESDAEVTFAFAKEPLDPRAAELVSKTNQFNLNGRRYTESQWKSFTQDPEVFLWIVSYQDKYGPLGKIAVLAGRKQGVVLQVDTWVMSCRAFSRRIEHRCLEQLFARFGVEEISFDVVPTPKNGPLQEFFAAYLGQPPTTRLGISRAVFLQKCPPTLPRSRVLGPES